MMNEPMVELICKKCNKPYKITKKKYDNYSAKFYNYICTECRSKQVKSYMNNISKEEKEKRYKKASETHKSNWASLSKEERDKRVKNAKDGINNMSDEKKLERSINSSKATTLVMKNLTSEQRLMRSQKLSEANKLRYKNMSFIEKKELGRKISEGQNARSDEDKIKSNLKRSESMKRYLENLSREEYEALRKKQAEGYNKYLDNLGNDPNKNEQDFMNRLLIEGFKNFKFQCYNLTKDPRFDDIFKIHPIFKSDHINPYHSWDFRISLLQKDIFVDIDGSIHDYDKTQYTVMDKQGRIFMMNEYIAFNDSKRPYQTDGLDSYVVKCYNDNLTNKTPVENIITGESITFESFILLLHVWNMTDKEIKDMIKFDDL